MKISPTSVNLVVLCVTFLATEAAVGGVILHLKGFAGGSGLTFLSLNTAISGLIGFVGGRASSRPAVELPAMPDPYRKGED